MGRPKMYSDRVDVGLRLDRDLRDALAAVAAERDVSANLLINKAIRRYLAELAPLDQAAPTQARAPRRRRDVSGAR